MPGSPRFSVLKLSRVAAPPWGAWLFYLLCFAGLFFWAMFVAMTPILTTGWWAMPDDTACVWLMLAMGIMVCASASCTVWALLLTSGCRYGGRRTSPSDEPHA